MPGTIVTYLAEQREPFARVPLNEVDSLILSTVAYFYFEQGALADLPVGERLPLPLALCGVRAADLFGDTWVSRMGGEPFLHALIRLRIDLYHVRCTARTVRMGDALPAPEAYLKRLFVSGGNIPTEGEYVDLTVTLRAIDEVRQ